MKTMPNDWLVYFVGWFIYALLIQFDIYTDPHLTVGEAIICSLICLTKGEMK